MKRRIVIGVAVAAVVVGGVATYAWAAGKDAAQTLNACVENDGKLRLIAIAGSCRKGETALSWNTVGPAGPAGQQGVPGRDGQPGPQGPAGPAAADRAAVTGTLMVTGQKQGSFSQTPIPIGGITHQITSPRDAASGLPTGKRQHKPLTIVKEWGASTPLLLNALVTNENLTSVLIGLLRNGQQVATIKLTNASISDYVSHGMTEEWSFTYQKIEWTWIDGGVTAQDDWEATP